MVYVESEDMKNLIRSYTLTAEEVDRMTNLSTKVWQHIQNLNFPDITGYAEDIGGILQFEEDLLNDKI